MTNPTAFLIPVAANIDTITPLQLERHAAQHGFIITNIQPYTPAQRITIADHHYWGADDPCGFNFWHGDIIADDHELPDINTALAEAAQDEQDASDMPD
jgi:hypothetical protein